MARGTTLALLVLLFSSLAVGDGIYKWIDEEGCVHSSDTPPDADYGEEVSVTAVPEFKTPIAVEKKAESAVGEVVGGVEVKVDTGDLSEPKALDAKQFQFTGAGCLDSIDSLLDPEKKPEEGSPDVFAPLAPRKLERDELVWLNNFLSKLSRSWSGKITEIICKGPDTAVREDKRTWTVEAEGSWSSRGFLNLDFDMTRDDRVKKRDTMSISTRGNQLHFRSSGPSFNSNPPKKCDDVEILSVDRNGLAYFAKYRRQTGPKRSLQVQDVYAFRVMDRAFQIDKATYVQGRLAGKSLWRMHR